MILEVIDGDLSGADIDGLWLCTLGVGSEPLYPAASGGVIHLLDHSIAVRLETLLGLGDKVTREELVIIQMLDRKELRGRHPSLDCSVLPHNLDLRPGG